jgi:uncharacterized membrane protein
MGMLATVSTSESELADKETGRVETISDGIFAIAMTLLVLDLHVPQVAAGQSLLDALHAEWPTFLAFLIGFFTLLVCWINHHYMFELIRRTDGVLMLLNGFKMLVVSFTPFATALLSNYIDTENQAIAVNVYALNFLLMGASMTGLWLYAARNGLARSKDPEILATASRYYIAATIIPALIFALSFVSVPASVVLFVFMFGVYVFPKAAVARLVARSAGGGVSAEAA